MESIDEELDYTTHLHNRNHVRIRNNNDELEQMFDTISWHIGYGILFAVNKIISFVQSCRVKAE